MCKIVCVRVCMCRCVFYVCFNARLRVHIKCVFLSECGCAWSNSVKLADGIVRNVIKLLLMQAR